MPTNWIGWMLSIFVLLLLLLAGYIMKNSVGLLITGTRAEGTVVGMDTNSRVSSEPGKETLKSPLVEFVTSEGERFRVSGRSYSESPTIQVGEIVTLAYSKSNPKNAQILQWKEFPIGPAGFVLGFAILLILIWISGILISGDSSMDDPFHLLPAVISRFRLNPFRFPVLFLLSIVIPICMTVTYVFSKRALDLKFNGIKAVGHVVGFVSKKDHDDMLTSDFPEIKFEDYSGKSHTILGSSKKGPLASPLKSGEVVEVIYLADHPEKGIVNAWDELYLFPLFFGLTGLCFLFVFRMMLTGAMDTPTTNPGNHKKLMTTGVPAIATVIEANPQTHILHYRIDKEPRMPATVLADFISLEGTFPDWNPTQADVKMKRGDQFRAYLDSLKPTKNFYVDFNDKIGNNPNVKSMEEEEAYEKEE
ncbi:MAG: DUF3592 domain-containing protein [Bacteroidota bacterium]|nr:DUF3592 domain-containing protein [Bacteroidota bacterium]